MSDKKEREDYRPEDMARSLLRMISNNIGQVSFVLWIRKRYCALLNIIK